MLCTAMCCILEVRQMPDEAQKFQQVDKCGPYIINFTASLDAELCTAYIFSSSYYLFLGYIA